MNSPFKFLESYNKSDANRFFGREKETAQLYNAVFASNLILLYGASGTGKTSLINCGLANKFYDSDWLPLFVRRGSDLNGSLENALQQNLGKLKTENSTLKTENTEGGVLTADLVEKLYRRHYRPVFLIFDQFEEIYILGKEAERQQFFQSIKNILEAKIPAKIIISIREEWIAYLNDFERIIPYLFENRLRVEKPDDRNLFRIVGGTLKAANIPLDEPPVTIQTILDNIRDRRSGVDLTNLQVYLDRVYRKAHERHPNDVRFDPSIVKTVGKMENVISDFLDEQMDGIEKSLAARGVKNTKGLPLEILYALVSDDGTKKPSEVSAIVDNLPKNVQLTNADINFCLDELKRIRILRETE